MAKLTRQQFITALLPTVLFIRREGSPIFPSVRLAQAILETGGVIHSWFNLGGIKVGTGVANAYWQGQAVVKGTWEHIDGRNVDMKAAFRAYSSVYHYWKDQDLLFARSRYDRVRLAQTPEAQAQMLYACGYATDPAYAKKLNTIMIQSALKPYDRMSGLPAPGGIFQGTREVAILQEGLVTATGYYLGGSVWVAARSLGEALGGVIDWNGTEVIVNGIPLETQLVGATGYVRVRDLAARLNKNAVWEEATRTVTLL